jgi:hypothetical protein
LLSRRSFPAHTFGAVSTFVLFWSAVIPTWVRRYLFTHYTPEILSNPVFEDLRKPKAPNTRDRIWRKRFVFWNGLDEMKSDMYIYLGFGWDENLVKIQILPFLKIRKSLEIHILCSKYYICFQKFQKIPINAMAPNELKKHN